MNIAKFIVISVFFVISSGLNGHTHRFTNNTAEVLDLEVDVTGEGNTEIREVMPKSSIKFDIKEGLFGGCLKGLNIWRTYRNRDWAGLIGVWKFHGSGKSCEDNEWILSYGTNSILDLLTKDQNFKNKSQHDQLETIKDKLYANRKTLLEEDNGTYVLTHPKGSSGQGALGSNNAWTNRVKGWS